LKLIFLEPHSIGAGGRTFDVLVGGKTILKNFDVVQAAGKHQAMVIREFTVAALSSQLVIELIPTGKLPPVLSGVEVQEQ
jgi:hypothetical protein